MTTGAEQVVAFLERTGHRHVFGVAGSTMVPLLHALDRSSLTFVPAAHESAAVAMADGYARVTGSGCALVYMLPGTANSLGNLYNAWRDESPLLVLAAQLAGPARMPHASVGEADLVRLVAPFTRLAWEVTAPETLAPWLARAHRRATAAPAGPAFLALPEDVLAGRAGDGPTPDTGREPNRPADVGSVAAALAAAQHPLFVVGGQLARCGGRGWLDAVAGRLGAGVAYEPFWNDQLAIGPAHPHCVGPLTPTSPANTRADVVVAVGTRYFNEVHPQPDRWFPQARFIAHVNADPDTVEAVSPAHWSCCADPAAFLAALCEELPDDTRTRWLDPPERDGVDTLAQLRGVLDHGWLVDESVSASRSLVQSLNSRDGRRYLATSGGSLGWGAGAACGVALGTGEPVTCVLGDGALLFGAQALWTAAALQLPVTFVVLDNGGYGSTRYFQRRYDPDLTLGSDFPATAPRPEDLLRGFGIATEQTDDLRPLLEKQVKGPRAIVVSTA